MTTKNRKLFFILALLSILAMLGLTGVNQAAAITFKPNVPIPGMAESTEITGDSIANYINIFYTYGSRLAALLAMFMLIIAGWQWTMAGGSPERINRSKDIIIGVFVGLALLLGGNVLMSQISERLVNFNTLDIKPIVPLKLVDGNSCCALREIRDQFGDSSNFLAVLRAAYTSSTVSCTEALGAAIMPRGYKQEDYHWQIYDGVEACQKAATFCSPASTGCKQDSHCADGRKCRDVGPINLSSFKCCVEVP